MFSEKNLNHNNDNNIPNNTKVVPKQRIISGSFKDVKKIDNENITHPEYVDVTEKLIWQ